MNIAFTKHKNDTIMVLLITSDDEYRRFYKLVFLQAIDSLIPID